MAATKHRAWLFTLAALALAACGAVAILAWTGGGGDASPSAAELPVLRLEADHATYAAVGDASAGADLIVRGLVQSHTTDPGTSPGVDGLGDPLPAIPHTNYLVSVQETLKGPAAPGSTVIVSLSGGTTEDGRFVLDGAPAIQDGDVAVFFLKDQGDGKRYPLAGGTAVAQQNADGSFTLPPDATGAGAVSFRQADVTGSGGPPQSVPQSPAAPPASSPPSQVAATKKLKCRRGFVKRKAHGKKRCVKVRKHHKQRKHRS